jgi:hypothetical protein
MENHTKIGKEPLRQALKPFLSTEKINAIQTALENEDGKIWREELGKWTIRMVPVELLVPRVYEEWRPLVREAMLFVMSQLSASRLPQKSWNRWICRWTHQRKDGC